MARKRCARNNASESRRRVDSAAPSILDAERAPRGVRGQAPRRGSAPVLSDRYENRAFDSSTCARRVRPWIPQVEYAAQKCVSIKLDAAEDAPDVVLAGVFFGTAFFGIFKLKKNILGA